MEYLPYENTVPVVKVTYFDQFYIGEDIRQLIYSLPDEPYGQSPDSQDPHSDSERGPQGPKIPPAQYAKLKPAAKALLMVDEKKACAIANFVRDNVFRELEPVPVDDLQNCAYQAALQQVSNLEYVFNTETGELILHQTSDFKSYTT